MAIPRNVQSDTSHHLKLLIDQTENEKTLRGLSQRWGSMRNGYAHDLFDRIQRVFSQRE
jgi:hypothetical protein